MNESTKQAVQILIDKCIGNRTLSAASDDTGLSRAKLHRLRNGQFTRIPANSVIMKLTDPKSNPQNNIKYSDFEKAKNDSKDDSEYDRDIRIIKSFDGIILDWLLKQADVIQVNRETHSFNLSACVNEVKYVFDYRIVNIRTLNLNKIKNAIFLKLANSLVKKDVKIVVVSNDKRLFNILKASPINIASKVIIMLISLDSGNVMDTAELN